MSEQIGLWRATYTPGEWLVLGGPTSLVIMQPAPPHVSPMVATFWELIVQADSLDALVEELAKYNIERMPDFGAFFWQGGQMRSLVRGEIRVLDAETGAELATGQGIRTWTEVGLGGVQRIRIELDDVEKEEALQLPLIVGAVTAASLEIDATEDALISSPQTAVIDTHEADAERASVPESALPSTEPLAVPEPHSDVAVEAPQTDDHAASESEPSAAKTAETADDPMDDSMEAEPAPQPELIPTANPFAPSSGAPRPPRPDVASSAYAGGFGPGSRAPQSYQPWVPAGQDGAQASEGENRGQDRGAESDDVLGVTCSQGHANPPEAQRCRRCGGPLQGQPRRMPRPLMATLRPSAGQPVDVDRSVLIGRSPQATKVNREHLPHLLTVVSPSHDISRTHVQVSPEGWEVVVTDLQSTNGTLLIRPGQPEPERLLPHDPVKVYPGCVIDLGDGVTILVDHPA